MDHATIGKTGRNLAGQPQVRVRLVWRVARKRHAINKGPVGKAVFDHMLNCPVNALPTGLEDVGSLFP